MTHTNLTKGAIVEVGISYKLTMISQNLKGTRYVSKDYHAGRDMFYESREDAELDAKIKIEVSQEKHIGNFVDFEIERIAS